MAGGGLVKRLRIVHRTGYHYDGTVAASYNEARMSPLTTPAQTALAARIEVFPVTWTYGYTDYFGTHVNAFDVLVPHDDLMVVSRSTVEVYDVPQPSAGAGWDILRDAVVCDARTEDLAQTGCTTPPDEVVVLAREVAGDLAPDDAARAVCERLRSMVDYVPGATGVNTGADEVWRARKGVCQDFAHLSLGALRSLGIPARYISGYLDPQPDAAVGQTVPGESHAWIEWWAGDWVGFDPTSLSPVRSDHIMVARGRDYADVPPLKGVYAGPPDSRLFVSVEVTRLV
jgi:transglutaminase-like putative cysteine protease